MDVEERGYMCRIDWEHERFQPTGGNQIFAEIEDLKNAHDCWRECGIVEVAVRLVRVVDEGAAEAPPSP